jgi:integrase
MATVERRNNRFRLIFYHLGRRYAARLKTANEREAEAIAGSVERTLQLLQQRVLVLPEGADLVTFVLSGGKQAEKPKPPPKPLTLGELRDLYVAAHSLGAMEANSLQTVRMHLNHVVTTLGAQFAVAKLTLEDLQRHVERRARKRYRGRPLSPVTLRKEMASFRACWNWGVQSGKLQGASPNRGLKYPKAGEKPPFQTWQEVQRQIARGGLTPAEEADLWDCLFLTLPQIDELLAFVKGQAGVPFLYPMVAFAAHTGARRSEMLRVRIDDLDFSGQTVLLREKKRSKEKRTFRRVPLSPLLTAVLQDWLETHPGGQHLFCQAAEVAHSKKERSGATPVTRDEAHDHFKWTLAGSRWEVLRGWHVFRHSFCSNCAAAGVDQRLIDAWVGHTTEEMRRRYRHLLPNQELQAIQAVFGTARKPPEEKEVNRTPESAPRSAG